MHELTLANAYVPVNALGMLKTILMAIVVPLILGNLTRTSLVKWKGQKAFMASFFRFPARLNDMWDGLPNKHICIPEDESHSRRSS